MIHFYLGVDLNSKLLDINWVKVILELESPTHTQKQQLRNDFEKFMDDIMATGQFQDHYHGRTLAFLVVQSGYSALHPEGRGKVSIQRLQNEIKRFYSTLDQQSASEKQCVAAYQSNWNPNWNQSLTRELNK